MKKLHLSKDKIVGGVCGGVAETLNIDLSIVRVVWGLAALAWRVGIFAYVICWIVFPEDTEAE